MNHRSDTSIITLSCLLAAVLWFCFPCHVAARSQQSSVETWSYAIDDSTGIIYAPDEKHFRPRYEEDEQDRKRQLWDKYWRWVETFYSGNLLFRGWTAECRNIVERIHNLDQRDRVIARMNVLGRLISAEWAKDNAIRLIDTADIRQWGLWLRESSIGNEIHVIFNIGTLFETLNRIESLVIEKIIKRASYQVERPPLTRPLFPNLRLMQQWCKFRTSGYARRISAQEHRVHRHQACLGHLDQFRVHFESIIKCFTYKLFEVERLL